MIGLFILILLMIILVPKVRKFQNILEKMAPNIEKMYELGDTLANIKEKEKYAEVRSQRCISADRYTNVNNIVGTAIYF